LLSKFVISFRGGHCDYSPLATTDVTSLHMTLVHSVIHCDYIYNLWLRSSAVVHNTQHSVFSTPSQIICTLWIKRTHHFTLRGTLL